MEIWTSRVYTCLAFLLLGLPLCFGLLSTSISTVCWRPRLEGVIEDNQCLIDQELDPRTEFFPKRGVFEVNGTDLERFLLLLNPQESTYAAVLVYAKWCPFSRALLPLFDYLSSSFPSIYHFAVEESALQQSAFFSYYGVNSFPVLFLHNKTAKIRYQGKRTLAAISKFYEGYSGLQPVSYQFDAAEKAVSLKRGEQEFAASWSSKGKLRDDVYLILSLVFLLSRGLFYLLPKLSSIVKQYWVDKELPWQACHGVLFHGQLFGQRKRTIHTATKCLKTDFRQETGKALLSVPSWPSSSLAAVSFAEGSGVKGGDV